MPIKDRKKRNRLILAGTIRLGYKETRQRKGGGEYTVPVQADHFLLHDAPDILAAYGPEQDGKVREIDVVMQFAEPERNFDANYELWAGGVLVCKGDGEFVDRAEPFTTKEKLDRDGKPKGIGVYNASGDTLVYNGVAMVKVKWNGEHFDIGDHVPCSGETKDLYPHCANCKMNSVLKMGMARPELVRYAYYKLSTKSGRNYDLIKDTLDGIYEAFGHVSGIRYHLRYVQQSTTYKDDTGKRRSTQKWFLELEPYTEDLQALYAKQRARLYSIRQLQAPQPDDEIIDVEGEYEAEEAAPPPFAEDGTPAESPAQPVEQAAQAEEDEKSRLTPQQQAAYYFTLPTSGKMLGRCGIDELLKLKDWCNERPNQANAKVTLIHVNVMLDYVAPDVES